ncbi:MAG: radical SAM protein [Thermoguttaceae bacterium]
MDRCREFADCDAACMRGEGRGGTAASPRRLCLSAIPRTGTPITTIDLDLTLDCNMRCVYCFKEKDHRQMPDRVAFDAVVWLLFASGPAEDLYVALMGGEPLLRFDLIKRLVPFGKRRAAYHGKRIQFSATTNNTLASDDIVEFFKRWGVGFHCSIDGIPEVQNRNRPMAGGGPSSALAERGIGKILAYQPWVTARCTVMPSTVERIVDNYKYFRSQGFLQIAMVPGCPGEWDDASNAAFARQFEDVAGLVMSEMRQGRFVRVTGIHDFVVSYAGGAARPSHMCGAGRGMALIDVAGNVWPCHRWNKGQHSVWRIGNIYEAFSEDARSALDSPSHLERLEAECTGCEAQSVCGGSCPAEALEENSSPFKPHASVCQHQRAWARIARRLYDTMRAEGNKTFLDQYYPPQDKKCEASGGGSGTPSDGDRPTA